MVFYDLRSRFEVRLNPRKPRVEFGSLSFVRAERVALYYFETSSEGTRAKRQWKNRIPFEWNENRGDRYDNASFRESAHPSTGTAKVTRFYSRRLKSYSDGISIVKGLKTGGTVDCLIYRNKSNS